MDVHFNRVPFGLDPLLAEAKRRTRRRRLVLAGLLIVALAAGLGAGFGLRSSPGGGIGGPPTGAAPSSLHGLVGQVERTIGASSILSAKVDGRVLTVQLASALPASTVVEEFEAKVLAYGLVDWMRAHHQRPITNLDLVAPTGKFYSGPEAIGSDATPALRPGACEGAGAHLGSTVSLVLARTLRFAGGICVLKVRATGTIEAGERRAETALSNAVPSLRNHASLIEIENKRGIPQHIGTWFPGVGFVGTGAIYCRRELPGLYCGLTHL
jgi:hypothetical protein